MCLTESGVVSKKEKEKKKEKSLHLIMTSSDIQHSSYSASWSIRRQDFTAEASVFLGNKPDLLTI